MKGHNTLILNAETVVEALQEYFDKRFAHPDDSLLEVRSVVITQNHNQHTSTPDFTVEVNEVTARDRSKLVAERLLGREPS